MKTSKWLKYYEDTKNYPPSELLVDAMQYVVHKGRAIDIGDGGLKDAEYLLEQGFKVMGVDAEPMLAEKVEALKNNNLHYAVARFDAFDFPKNEYDLATAIYALPFNSPESFNVMFEKLKKSLKKNGIFCGQFFGIRDEWNTPNSKMSYHTKEEVEKLLEGFHVITFKEVEKDGYTAAATRKHWHVFHIIAKRQS